MTAQDFANTNENVVVFFAGNGCPAGTSVALLDGAELPFDLGEVEGEVNGDGAFEATNLNDGSGLHGWRFHDWNMNVVYKIQLFSDVAEWNRQNDEFMAQA